MGHFTKLEAYAQIQLLMLVMEVKLMIFPQHNCFLISNINTEDLSRAVREVVAEQESRNIPFEEVVRLVGFAGFDRSGKIVWLSE
jgi:hypothetical protein